jgi:hypothetical protein
MLFPSILLVVKKYWGPVYFRENCRMSPLVKKSVFCARDNEKYLGAKINGSFYLEAESWQGQLATQSGLWRLMAYRLNSGRKQPVVKQPNRKFT